MLMRVVVCLVTLSNRPAPSRRTSKPFSKARVWGLFFAGGRALCVAQEGVGRPWYGWRKVLYGPPQQRR
eukprot:3833870-Lingulodinium_polyedra.AAC.1